MAQRKGMQETPFYSSLDLLCLQHISFARLGWNKSVNCPPRVCASLVNSVILSRVCEVHLNGDKTFTLRQHKYKVSDTLKTGEASALFGECFGQMAV
jgi:Hexokinase